MFKSADEPDPKTNRLRDCVDDLFAPLGRARLDATWVRARGRLSWKLVLASFTLMALSGALIGTHLASIDRNNDNMRVAIAHGDLRTIKQLIREGVPMEGGETIDPLLLIAAETENFESFKLLLELGADPNDVSGIKSAAHAMKRTDFQLEVLKARRTNTLGQ